MKRWRADPTEENFWGVVVFYAGGEDLKPTLDCHLLMRCGKAGTASTRKNCGLTDGRRVKVWCGALCCWR